MQVESTSAIRSPTHPANSPERTCRSMTSPVSGSGRRTTSAASSGSGWRSASSWSSAVGAESERSGFGRPLVAHRGRVDLGLGGAGLQHRLGGCGGAFGAGLGHRGFDLRASLGERRQDLGGDAGDLDQALAGRPPVDAELLGELVGEGGAEHRAGGVLGPVEALRVEGGPASVGAAGDVGDQDVGVQVRVAGAAGAVPERGGDEPVAGQAAGAEVDRGASARARLFDPRRTKQPSRSSQPSVSTAVVAATTTDSTSGSPNPYRTDTDFGAAKVRSKPGPDP